LPTSLPARAERRRALARGTRGPARRQAADDEDRGEIRKSIDEKILGSHAIVFRSSDVRLPDDGGRLTVEDDLSVAGSIGPVTAQPSVEGGGGVSGTIPLPQIDWGIKPYRGLMGALKVRDEIEVVIAATLAAS
jgi:hypothetical protein